jgi:hypothetical protein
MQMATFSFQVLMTGELFSGIGKLVAVTMFFRPCLCLTVMIEALSLALLMARYVT